MTGRLDFQVIDAFQREHAAAERSGNAFRRVQSKTNLGSALLNMANDVVSPAEYVRMYRESEELLLAALRLQPTNADVKHNLEVVRQNRMKRAGAEADAAAKFGDERKSEYSSSVDDKVLQDKMQTKSVTS